MIIYRVTDLDSIIWYKKTEDMSIDDMRARLLRTEPPNEKMAIGSAWHSILENPPLENEINHVETKGYVFNIECQAELELPQVREIRANKTYLIDDINIILSGGCDGISGNKITDHKLTFRENIDTYFESYQWRAYLDIFNADIFEYWIYSARQKGNVITINNISSIKMYRYPEMINDLKGGIRDLYEFTRDYVPELTK